MLVTMFVIALCFAVAGVTVEVFADFNQADIVAAHLGVYAIISAFLGVTGYAILYLAIAVRKVHRELGVAT